MTEKIHDRKKSITEKKVGFFFCFQLTIFKNVPLLTSSSSSSSLSLLPGSGSSSIILSNKLKGLEPPPPKPLKPRSKPTTKPSKPITKPSKPRTKPSKSSKNLSSSQKPGGCNYRKSFGPVDGKKLMLRRKRERIKKEESLAKFLQEVRVEQQKTLKELKELEKFGFEVCFLVLRNFEKFLIFFCF